MDLVGHYPNIYYTHIIFPHIASLSLSRTMQTWLFPHLISNLTISYKRFFFQICLDFFGLRNSIYNRKSIRRNEKYYFEHFFSCSKLLKAYSKRCCKNWLRIYFIWRFWSVHEIFLSPLGLVLLLQPLHLRAKFDLKFI